MTKSHWSPLLVILSLFIFRIYVALIFLFYLWHEVHCCHQKACRFSHMNGFHPKFEQFKEEYWKIKCKLCVFPLNSFKENKWTSRWRMELHPTWKIVNICLKCFCIVHASCCHVMKKGGEIFKVICCGSAPLICVFSFNFNSNGTNIQFWWIWILTLVSSFFCFTTHNYFYQHFEHTAVKNFFGSKTISPVALTVHSTFMLQKTVKAALKCPASPR